MPEDLPGTPDPGMPLAMEHAMNTKNRFHHIGFTGFTVWVLLQFVALSSMVACGEVTPYHSYGTVEESGPMAGKSDGSFQWEDSPPTLHEAYWLTGESRVLVEGLDDEGDGELVSYFSGLAIVNQDGRDLTITFQPCDIQLPDLAGREFELQKEALQSISSGPVEGGLLRSEDGRDWELWTADSTMVLGADLNDPSVDPIPVSKDDPTLVDADQDGKPGISVVSGSFKIYGAFRFRLALTAKMNEAGGFSGDSSLEVEHQLYGDDIPFYNAVKAAEAALDELVVLDTSHSASLVPISLDEATCVGREILAAESR